jgi:uncharacterized Zn finger protein
MTPKECSSCGWVATPKDCGRTILYKCERCGQMWRVEKPVQHQVMQSRLEGFK